MEDYALKIVYGLFGATVTVSLLIAVYQYFFERKKIFLLSIFYWLATLASLVVNLFVQDKESDLYFFSVLSTFVSQFVLAEVMCQIKGIKLPYKWLILFFAVTIAISNILKHLDQSYEIYITFGVFGAVFPVFYAVRLVYKKNNSAFTSAQFLFFLFSILLTVHYLDYAFLKGEKELFVIASAVAFFLLHVIATLIPMVVNEYSLYVKNLNLEHEISQRVLEVRKKDLQLWESSKIEVLGRFSGVLAHELNTPISAISIAVASIGNILARTPVDMDKVYDKLDKIKLVLRQITNMTTALRTASGDLVGENLSRVDLRDVINENKNSMEEFCKKNNISISIDFQDQDYPVDANKNELSQVLKTLIINMMDTLKNRPNPWLKISLNKDASNCFIIFLDNRDSKATLKNGNLNGENKNVYDIGVSLDIVVIKSILKTHKGEIDFSFENLNQKTVLTFPIRKGN